eukprot:366458-Chlamydomonas_euryale.AAC.18
MTADIQYVHSCRAHVVCPCPSHRPCPAPNTVPHPHPPAVPASGPHIAPTLSFPPHRAQARGSCSMRVNGANVTFAEPDVVRLLARRPERTSSKLLKELYRMPKKLSLQMASAPPRGANGAGDGGGR